MRRFYEIGQNQNGLATDKQHGQYAICSAIASQTAYLVGNVSGNMFWPLNVKKDLNGIQALWGNR